MSKNKAKNKAKLLIQVTAIVLPLFLILSGAVIWVFYRSTINSFLTAQNERIEKNLNNNYDSIISTSDHDRIMQNKWLITYLEEHSDKEMIRITLEESDEFDDLMEEERIRWDEKLWTEEWLYGLSGKLKDYVANMLYFTWQTSVDFETELNNYEKVFIMDTHGSYTGMVICESEGSGKVRKFGDYYDFRLSEHEALKEAVESGSDKFVFEISEDFPDEGNYYIAYKPVNIDGENWAVLGLTYNWDEFKKSIDSNLRTAQFLLISGFIIIMAVLLFLLYRKTIKPVSEIQRALIAYTNDKSSAQIVAKMMKVYKNNEIGYLSDVISDLALEIDHYTKEVARSERELYEARVQIMVSQIRPHFMYNTLSSIAMLCEIDPEAAQEMTITFAKYLRENMDSLKQTKPVPFTRELEHLKKYLYIEKIRFDDRLNIEYDIQATDFELPQLSIQPLVENAVKHGIGKKEEGGTVTIATRETDTAFEVIVSDDGVGFDMNAPQKDDGRSHIGMENIKKRLKDMCSAEIVIESEPGRGTTAKVIIPKTKKEDKDK